MLFPNSSKLLLNVNKMYWKSRVIAVSNRLLAFNANQLPKEQNVLKCQNILSSYVQTLRQYSDGKAKSGKSGKRPEPQKLSFVDDMPKLTHIERLKRVIQNYGATAVVLHIVLSLTSLGTFYSVLYFGFDITEYIDLDQFGETTAKVMASSGTFAVAYTLHKMVMPARVGATIILTPIVVGQLRKIGLIKKPHKYL